MAAQQGWTIDNVGHTITFYTPPANGAAITVQEFAQGAVNATDLWALGAWGPHTGYPVEVEFFSSRLFFAGTANDPQTIWTSKISNYINYGKSVPTADDDGITATLVAKQVNAITDLLPLKDLVMLTTGSEWKAGGGANAVLTPSSVSFTPQSNYGSSGIPGLIVGESGLFVQGRGSYVRDIGYQFSVDSYTGNDLTVFASHLVQGHTIIDWTYQQNPFSVVWAVRDDGLLLGLAYFKEQQVMGWFHCDTINGFVESVCCVTEGEEDAVYVSVRRVINGATVRYIERLDTRFQTDQRDYFFVDAGLSFDGRNTTTNPTDTMTLTVAPVTTTTPVVANAEPFGTGDGVTTAFALKYQGATLINPQSLTAAIYCNDWEGNQLQYATPRTNTLLRSQTIGSSGWNLTSVVATANAAVAPDGSTTATLLVPAAGISSNTYRVTQMAGIVTGSNNIDIFVKSAGCAAVYIDTLGRTPTVAPDSSITVNLITGTLLASGSSTNISVTPLANGWFRLRYTSPDYATATLREFRITPLVIAQTSAQNGDGVSGIYAWGAGVYAQAASYIPTTSSTASVTDYTLDALGNVTLAVPPVIGAALTWTGTSTTDIPTTPPFASAIALTLTCTAPIFSSTNPGDWVKLYGTTLDVNGSPVLLVVKIVAFVSSTVVTVNAIGSVPAAFQNTPIAAWDFCPLSFSGLNHLIGQTVAILADGNVKPQQIVSAGGSITLDYPAAVVQVGLPIQSDFETLEVNAIGQEGVRDKRKIISKVTLVVNQSRGAKIGPDSAHLTEAKGRQVTDGYYNPNALQNDLIEQYIENTFSTNGRVFVRQDDPLPLTILGLIADVSVGGG